VQLYETVFKSTVYETEHPVVQVHPLTGERAIKMNKLDRERLERLAAFARHFGIPKLPSGSGIHRRARVRWKTRLSSRGLR
jgi:alpha-ketoglutarate-dependent taurine dioxygenase